ncbi:phage holin family protein [Lacrimispora algidixylanolytica]|uniref:Uncharacterized protein n=1 Tax=Lacrimispora algidixylanolytica TaxID=94868 RepID=A0A419T1I3_9FIRM|nr:hypothetical protein BET01_20950 [Lacrimispora algidixylanolytica]
MKTGQTVCHNCLTGFHYSVGTNNMPIFFLIIPEVGCGQSPQKKLQVTNICKGTARKTWLICNEVTSTLENLIDIGVDIPPFLMHIV